MNYFPKLNFDLKRFAKKHFVHFVFFCVRTNVTDIQKVVFSNIDN